MKGKEGRNRFTFVEYSGCARTNVGKNFRPQRSIEIEHLIWVHIRKYSMSTTVYVRK